jgi:hypothetical protein
LILKKLNDMAIKIQTSHAMLIVFWFGVFLTLGSFSFGINNGFSNDIFLAIIFGLISNTTTFIYYNKVGWSELGIESLGCIATILIISFLFYLWDLFFA